MTLAVAPFGKELKIVSIGADEKIRRHLENLGLIAGAPVTTVFDRKGGLILKVKDSRLAIDRALASKIFVA